MAVLLTLSLVLMFVPINVKAEESNEITSTTVVEAGKTYTIASLQSLKAFKTLVEAGNTFEGATVKLLANIQMGDGTKWVAIGASQGSNASTSNMKAFKGIFDGQGYILKNITFVYENKNTYGIGFFAKLDGAIVKNVKMTGVQYAVTNTSYYSYYDIGSIAGYITNSTIDNCTVNGSMGPGAQSAGSSTPSMYNVGGIVGFATLNSNISNCTNNLNIDLFTSIYQQKNSGVGYPIGGIVGRAYSCKITGCENKARVAGGGGDTYGSEGLGGIVGYITGQTTIDRCLNSGEAVAYNIGAGSVYSGPAGGIAGRTYGNNITITNCWNKGYVAPYGECGGGIIGISGETNCSASKEIYSGAKYPVTVFNCLNTGKIWSNNAGQGRFENTASSSTGDGRGGIVGFVGNTSGVYIENSFNQGKVLEGSTYSSARFSGGIIGSTELGSYLFAVINHNYLLDQNDGLATQRWYTSQSGSAGLKVLDSSKDYIGPMQDNADDICNQLNTFAGKKTSWSVENSSNGISKVNVITTEEARDYVNWIYDSDGEINNGLPYIDLQNIGYNQSKAASTRN